MSLTPFPHGVSSFGMPVLGGGSEMTTGDIFFVHNGTGSAGYEGTDPAHPLNSIDNAINKCTASKGDIIYVMPGHAETISGAGGITCDVAGVSIIGLGSGNLRPTLTWSATASSILITAANVKLKNLITTISEDEVVSMFACSAAGCTIDGVDFKEYGAKGATGQAIQFLLTTAAADDLTMMNCRHMQMTAATADQVWIQLVGNTNARILNNSIHMTAKAATASICINGSTATVESEVVGNRIVWYGATITSPISFITTSTGIIAQNLIAMSGAAVLSTVIVGDAMHVFENYITDTPATSGLLAPAVDAVT